MAEMNFCPFCDAPRHKLAVLKENLVFCKECNEFFRIQPEEYECYKCNSKKFEDSEFPAPDGKLVLQCKKCKKMYSADDFFRQNQKVEEEN